MNDFKLSYEITKQFSSKAFMQMVSKLSVDSGKTAMWTLGQNGYIVKTEIGTLIGVDPYLTDYCASGRTKISNEKSRILPVFIEPEDFYVDIMLLTHSHCDHTDPFTLERYRHKNETIFVGPWQTIEILKNAGIPDENIFVIHPLQSLQLKDITVTATYAVPTDATDLNHIGLIIQFSSGKTYYNSGDTANTGLLKYLREYKIDWMSICINGGFNNTNYWQAAEITSDILPKFAIPSHFDMMPHNIQLPHMFQIALERLSPTTKYVQLSYYSHTDF